MVSTLFPEMTHSFFRPLLERLGQDRQEKPMAAHEARELLFGCVTAAAVLDGLMDMLQQVLEQGLESRKAGLLHKEFADVVGMALSDAYPKARGLLTSATMSEEERRTTLETL